MPIDSPSHRARPPWSGAWYTTTKQMLPTLRNLNAAASAGTPHLLNPEPRLCRTTAGKLRDLLQTVAF